MIFRGADRVTTRSTDPERTFDVREEASTGLLLWMPYKNHCILLNKRDQRIFLGHPQGLYHS